MTAFAPLRERDFRLLFLGRVTSLAGTAMAPVALAFAVLELSDSLSDLGIVLAARLVPQVIFMLVGGVWADRLPRSAVMVGANLTSGAAQGLVALLLLTGAAQIWNLVALQLLAGASSAFFFPASQGIIPQTVPRHLLQQANALLRMSMSATQIGGAAAGGILVAAVGSGWALAFDAATYVLAAIFLGRISVRAAERATTSFLAELREGWQEFSTRTWLWVIVVVFAFLNAAHSGTSQVLGPVIARDELGGAAAWGFILAAQAAGLLLGGVLMLWLRVRRLLLVGCAVIALEIPGLALLALGAPTLAIAGGYLLAGIGIEVFSVYWDIALQENVDQEKLSRVYSYDALGSLVLIPLGFVAAGPLAELLGTDETIWLAAGVIGVGVLGMLLVKDVRTLERRRTEA